MSNDTPLPQSIIALSNRLVSEGESLIQDGGAMINLGFAIGSPDATIEDIVRLADTAGMKIELEISDRSSDCVSHSEASEEDLEEHQYDSDWWDRFCKLGRYSFRFADGGVRKVDDIGGAWVEQHKAAQIVDAMQSEINELKAQLKQASCLPEGWAFEKHPDGKVVVRHEDGTATLLEGSSKSILAHMLYRLARDILAQQAKK